MAYNNDNFQPRQMFQGNWTCSKCGAEITELPFEPTEGKDILCKECHRSQRESRPSNRFGGPRGNFGGPRRMVSGNWKCAGCGTSIHELPFEPKDGSDVYCRDCYSQRRAA